MFRLNRFFPLVLAAVCSTVTAACGRTYLDEGQPVDAAADGASAADAGTIVDAGANADVSDAPEDARAVDAGVEAESGSCIILASNYDQSCTVDSDCKDVTAGDYCSTLCPCGGSSINVGAVAQFNQDVSRTPLGSGAIAWDACPCLTAGGPCCRQGTCHMNTCVLPSDTLAACADAGGSCNMLTLGCARLGPANSCAYPDEACCLP
jgi:hypothetical protein